MMTTRCAMKHVRYATCFTQQVFIRTGAILMKAFMTLNFLIEDKKQATSFVVFKC